MHQFPPNLITSSSLTGQISLLRIILHKTTGHNQLSVPKIKPLVRKSSKSLNVTYPLFFFLLKGCRQHPFQLLFCHKDHLTLLCCACSLIQTRTVIKLIILLQPSFYTTTSLMHSTFAKLADGGITTYTFLLIV